MEIRIVEYKKIREIRDIRKKDRNEGHTRMAKEQEGFRGGIEGEIEKG